jgi:hypothetical protein
MRDLVFGARHALWIMLIMPLLQIAPASRFEQITPEKQYKLAKLSLPIGILSAFDFRVLCSFINFLARFRLSNHEKVHRYFSSVLLSLLLNTFTGLANLGCTLDSFSYIHVSNTTITFAASVTKNCLFSQNGVNISVSKTITDELCLSALSSLMSCYLPRFPSLIEHTALCRNRRTSKATRQSLLQY